MQVTTKSGSVYTLVDGIVAKTTKESRFYGKRPEIFDGLVEWGWAVTGEYLQLVVRFKSDNHDCIGFRTSAVVSFTE